MANFCLMQTVDIPTETIKLVDTQSDVDRDSVATHISSTSPRYSFYHYPGSDVVVFVYTCPTGSSIKERMLHASSRRNAIAVAEGEGLKISKVCSLSAVGDAVVLTLANNRLRPRGRMKSLETGCRRRSTLQRIRVRREDSPDLDARADKSRH